MYHIFLFLILQISLFIQPVFSQNNFTVVEDKAKTPILSPDFQERKTLKLRLPNGLEAYLISDPKIEKSGAVLSVEAGSFQDPKEYPGLAHFLEHMLFLGTKKYPKESEYSRFITENGGVNNAYTSSTYTSYMFSINNNAFEEALDRFSEFFKEPLFNPSGVARELQAIDQEYAKNIENDDIRLWYVSKATENRDHPYHHFNMGNSDTLSNVDQKTLKKWYEDHYSANLMHLVVYSSLPIDTLKNLVVKDFEGIVNRNKKKFESSISPFNNSKDEIIFVEPIKHTKNLVIIWGLPPQFSKMKDSQPGSVVCYVLGHEGKNSLLADLKKEHLAEKLSCGTIKVGDYLQFVIDIDLTDLGVENYNLVIERVFQAIKDFEVNGAPQYLYDEIRQINTLNYQYQSKEDAFDLMMKHADWIVHEDLSTYPEQTRIIQKFDPKAIVSFLQHLTTKNTKFFLMAPSALTKVETDKKEPWLGVDFTIKPIDKKLIEKWNNVILNPNITLPEENKFIPYQVEVKKAALRNEFFIPVPEVIIDNKMGKVYFSKDTQYNVPKIRWNFEIKTPEVDLGNSYKSAMADLYVKSLKDTLSTLSYPASLAGLEYEISREDYGISITIEGYSEKAELLFQEIVKKLAYMPSEEEFKIFHASLLHEYQNFSKKMPIEQASQCLKTVLYKSFATEKSKGIALNRINYEKFKEYVLTLFDQYYIEGMLYGDIEKESAERVTGYLTSAFKGTPYPKDRQKKKQVILLPNDQGPFYLETKSTSLGNAVILAIQQSQFDFKQRAMQQIFMQAIKEPFFSTLRTKQQTGYLVFSEAREVKKQLFSLFAVQSNTHAVRDLLARFELFIEGYLQELVEEIPEKRFNLLKESVILDLKHSTHNISDMGELLQRLAFEYNGDFEWFDKRIQGLTDLTYPEFLTLAEEIYGRENKQRVAILLKGQFPKENIFEFTPIQNLSSLKKLSKYTNGDK